MAARQDGDPPAPDLTLVDPANLPEFDASVVRLAEPVVFYAPGDRVVLGSARLGERSTWPYRLTRRLLLLVLLLVPATLAVLAMSPPDASGTKTDLIVEGVVVVAFTVTVLVVEGGWPRAQVIEFRNLKRKPASYWGPVWRAWTSLRDAIDVRVAHGTGLGQPKYHVTVVIPDGSGERQLLIASSHPDAGAGDAAYRAVLGFAAMLARELKLPLRVREA